jgi:hypothetical protein
VFAWYYAPPFFNWDTHTHASVLHSARRLVVIWIYGTSLLLFYGMYPFTGRRWATICIEAFVSANVTWRAIWIFLFDTYALEINTLIAIEINTFLGLVITNVYQANSDASNACIWQSFIMNILKEKIVEYIFGLFHIN